MDKNHEVYRHKHIVLAVDHYNPLGIVRSLGEEGIRPIVLLCGEDHHLVSKSKYIGEYHHFETIEDGLQFIIKNFSNDSLKPFIYNGSDDITLLLDSHYIELKNHFYFTHGQGGIEKYLQKYDITQLAKSCGIGIPKEELLKVGKMPSTLKYPVITKAATSIGDLSWKEQTFICKDEKELQIAYKSIKAPTILVQEFIRKKNELCIDGISINGGEQVFMPYGCNYYRFVDGAFGEYMYFRPFEDKDLAGKITKVIRGAKFTGIFCVEFMIGPDDNLYFLEVNFRNSGWSYAFTYGGFNLPFRWAVSTIDNQLYLSDFKPLKQFDAMSEFADFAVFVKNKKLVPFCQWLKEFRKSVCYTYNKKDKKPFYYFLLHKVLKQFNR